MSTGAIKPSHRLIKLRFNDSTRGSNREQDLGSTPLGYLSGWASEQQGLISLGAALKADRYMDYELAWHH